MKNGFGVIDVNIPEHITDPNVSEISPCKWNKCSLTFCRIPQNLLMRIPMTHVAFLRANWQHTYGKTTSRKLYSKAIA